MFFKKKPVIRAWCDCPSIASIAPIKPAIHFFPNWLKNAPRHRPGTVINGCPVDKGTVKNCPGVIEFLKTGYIIPSWCDFHMEVKPGEIICNTPDSRFVTRPFPSNQFVDYLPQSYDRQESVIVKLVNPWKIEISKGYKILYMSPYFNNIENNLDIIPGIRDSNTYFPSNIFLFFKKTGNYVIPRGTPLSVIVPIKDEKSTLKIIDINKNPDLLKKYQYMSDKINTKFSDGFKIKCNV